MSIAQAFELTVDEGCDDGPVLDDSAQTMRRQRREVRKAKAKRREKKREKKREKREKKEREKKVVRFADDNNSSTCEPCETCNCNAGQDKLQSFIMGLVVALLFSYWLRPK
jgi:acetyl-CoA carboxylase carboxyltransferase component